VQVREEYPVHILPPDLYLVEALQSAATCVEEELLSARFHQDAWPEAIHDRRGAASTQQSHLDFLLLGGRRDKGGGKQYDP
jgi:hypothetical protein